MAQFKRFARGFLTFIGGLSLFFASAGLGYIPSILSLKEAGNVDRAYFFTLCLFLMGAICIIISSRIKFPEDAQPHSIFRRLLGWTIFCLGALMIGSAVIGIPLLLLGFFALRQRKQLNSLKKQ